MVAAVEAAADVDFADTIDLFGVHKILRMKPLAVSLSKTQRRLDHGQR